MIKISLKASLVGTIAALIASALLGGTAQAGPASPPTAADMQNVADRVFGSTNPEAALASLSAVDLATLKSAMAFQTATVTSSIRQVDVAATSGTDSNLLVAATTSCWNQYVYMEWRDFGYHEGDTWMTLNWCGSGGRITSYYVSLAGCRGTAGFSCEGPIDGGFNNVTWEVRAFKEFHFWLGVLNGYGCEQIRGGATGLYSSRASCNLS